jgi:hypothetical protein
MQKTCGEPDLLLRPFGAVVLLVDMCMAIPTFIDVTPYRLYYSSYENDADHP